jgi:septal ring factor EnvC (AmiA/AmiB activator)
MRPLGKKIGVLNLSSMIAKCLLALLLGGALFAAPPESVAIQELRLSLENMKHRLHTQSVDLSLFQERFQNLENSLANLKASKHVERRIIALEKANEALLKDFKTLKGYLNETAETLTQCQSQLNRIDKQLSSDIQALKSSLNAMLALLQPTSSTSRAYIVQSGDSLGQIALDNKTDIKTLKKLNNLPSDTIYSGQKLLLP